MLFHKNIIDGNKRNQMYVLYRVNDETGLFNKSPNIT